MNRPTRKRRGTRRTRGPAFTTLGTHFNPGDRRDGKAENIKLVDRLARLVDQAQARGEIALVLADFNGTAGEHGEDTPRALARQADLDLVMRGIDGGAFDEALDVEVLEVWTPPGSNHDAILFKLAAPDGTVVRAITSNMYAPNGRRDEYARSLDRRDADVIVVQEGQRLGKIRGYRRHGGRGRLRGGVRAYTRRETTVLERTWWRQLSARGASRYTHPRSTRAVTFRKVAHR